MVLTIFLVIFIFFENLDLKLINISISKVLSKLIFIFILILMISIILISLIFLSWPITFWIPKVDFFIFKSG